MQKYVSEIKGKKKKRERMNKKKKGKKKDNQSMLTYFTVFF